MDELTLAESVSVNLGGAAANETGLLPTTDSVESEALSNLNSSSAALGVSGTQVLEQELLFIENSAALSSEISSSPTLSSEVDLLEAVDEISPVGVTPLEVGDALIASRRRGRRMRQRPVVFAELANDTTFDGGTESDGITADSSIAGSIETFKDTPVKKLQVRVDSRDRRDFVDVSYALDDEGNFHLDRADLEKVKGAPLDDGDHTVFIRAFDERNRLSMVKKVNFELNRVLYAISSEDTRELALVNTETDQLLLKSLDDIEG